MRLVLLIFAFSTAGLSTTAQTATLSSEKPGKTTEATHKARPVASATRMKFQPGQEAIKVNVGHHGAQTRPVVQSATPSEPVGDEPEGLSYGTLLATLALMAAIAVRRLKAGRP